MDKFKAYLIHKLGGVTLKELFDEKERSRWAGHLIGAGRVTASCTHQYATGYDEGLRKAEAMFEIRLQSVRAGLTARVNAALQQAGTPLVYSAEDGKIVHV